MRNEVATGSGGVKSVPNDWIDGPVIYLDASPIKRPAIIKDSFTDPFITLNYNRKKLLPAIFPTSLRDLLSFQLKTVFRI